MTTVKHQPTTPLPWTDEETILPATLLDAKYAAHAANAYPKLVKALRAVTQSRPKEENPFGWPEPWESDVTAAQSILRELGEAS